MAERHHVYRRGYEVLAHVSDCYRSFFQIMERMASRVDGCGEKKEADGGRYSPRGERERTAEKLRRSWNWFFRKRRREAGNYCYIPSSLRWHTRTHTPVRTHLHTHFADSAPDTHTHTPLPPWLLPFNLARTQTQISGDHLWKCFFSGVFLPIRVAKLALLVDSGYTSNGNMELEVMKNTCVCVCAFGYNSLQWYWSAQGTELWDYFCHYFLQRPRQPFFWFMTSQQEFLGGYETFWNESPYVCFVCMSVKRSKPCLWIVYGACSCNVLHHLRCWQNSGGPLQSFRFIHVLKCNGAEYSLPNHDSLERSCFYVVIFQYITIVKHLL